MKAFGTARLGSDMEVRYLTDGTAVGGVSLAFRTGVKDKEGNYKTQWVNASLFGKRADSLSAYLKKGSLHAFHLSDLHIDEYTTKDGEKRVSLKARIDDVELCGKHEEQAEPASKPKQQSQPAKQQAGDSLADFDDNIPF